MCGNFFQVMRIFKLLRLVIWDSVLFRNTMVRKYIQVIEYRISPILRIPFYWMTEITHAEELKYFIDVQRKGPFSLWHHQHHFKEIEGGVEMTDVIHYKNPFGFVGEAAHSLFVKRQLKRIFEYRYIKTEELLGKWEGQIAFIQIE